jgi:outer membrane protein assembly factor BamB
MKRSCRTILDTPFEVGHPSTVNRILAWSLSLVAALWCARARAADWPNFRGPNHNGISSETGWLVKWPTEGPPVLWKASLGVGYASITVAQGCAYATGNHEATATLYCFDADTGSNLWHFSYASDLYSKYNGNGNDGLGGTSGSPTVQGNRVFLMSGDGCLYALETPGGSVVWSNNLAADLGAAKPFWGFSSSALVQDDLLILAVGGFGTAVDKTTGKVVWTSSKAASGYSTPVPCLFNGVSAVAIFSGDAAYGVETKSGRPIWSFPFKTQYNLNIADVVVSNNNIFVSAAYGHGGAMARLVGTNATQVWANKTFANHVSSSVLVDGYLYGVAGMVGGSKAELKCVAFDTGAEKWSYPGVGSGGFMVADHKIIMLTDGGELLVGEVSPDAFVPIAQAQVIRPSCWSSPTLANGRIYCRNNKGDLVCLDVKGH